MLDSSAVVALLAGEPEADVIRARMDAAAGRVMSAFTLFETRTVLHRRFGAAMTHFLERLLDEFEVRLHPFDAEQASVAFRAYRRFGKGSGHPARLNLGDCASYALAHSLNLPLLFKGDDFPRTDIRSATAPLS